MEIAIYFDSRLDWIYRRDQPRDVVLPPLQPEHPEEAGKHHDIMTSEQDMGRPT